jgi:hypothetical protein
MKAPARGRGFVYGPRGDSAILDQNAFLALQDAGSASIPIVPGLGRADSSPKAGMELPAIFTVHTGVGTQPAPDCAQSHRLTPLFV